MAGFAVSINGWIWVSTEVAGLETTAGNPSFREKYNNFILTAGDHMKIFGPFIPALTQLLTGG